MQARSCGQGYLSFVPRYITARATLGHQLALCDRLVRQRDWAKAHAAIVEAKAMLDGVEAGFLEDLRESGRSWEDLGAEVLGGISKSGARQRYERVKSRSSA